MSEQYRERVLHQVLLESDPVWGGAGPQILFTAMDHDPQGRTVWFTPSEAREVALMLLSEADRIEAASKEVAPEALLTWAATETVKDFLTAKEKEENPT